MKPEDFDYCLPGELIAQYPLSERDASRLLVLYRNGGATEHLAFRDIKRYLRKGDVILFNDTRVIPARLTGKKTTGGRVEIFLVERVKEGKESEEWRCMVSPAKGIRKGARVEFGDRGGGGIAADYIGKDPDGLWVFVFSGRDVRGRMAGLGAVPLPPYIRRAADESDRTRYQTVFAKNDGAVAAPTAGLHFTEKIIEEIRGMGVEVHYLTLHTGPATFMPVREGDISRHAVPGESFRIEPEAAGSIVRAKREKRRVVAIGSTVTRAIESAFMGGFDNPVLSGKTSLTIYPGFSFRVVDALVTNFHLPRSTLLMLVCAFAGKENVMRAYREAVALRYRFYSYGDCMMVV
ncbi:MAG: tRNA preQ1(34) S-adenosylmethionine ribosyltransferase-isomerase QueA [Deltaproteobacteria bacterium]|nr:tRNA preQ1(34) S-adenosylmethionine ribosyltransferase-isomerase QueA [Deltaproteobacteria bacterium]